jgi:hypothetical protein
MGITVAFLSKRRKAGIRRPHRVIRRTNASRMGHWWAFSVRGLRALARAMSPATGKTLRRSTQLTPTEPKDLVAFLRAL